MKTMYFNNGFFSILTVVLLLSLFLVSNTCKSQKNENDTRLLAAINLNTFDNNQKEQSLRQAKSERITKHLKLSIKERELLIDIRQLLIEAKQCINDADLVAKEIHAINKTTDNSYENSLNNFKTERKIRKQENYELSLRYDAEELFEMGNSLLFKIYEDHFPSSGVLIAKDHKYQKQIVELRDEAQELYQNARINQDKANYDFNYEDGIDYLRKANLLKREAIKKFEQAYCLYYNMPINKSEYAKFSADININSQIDKKFTNDSVKTNLFNSNATIKSYNNIKKPDESVEIIVYKIQIGAFTKSANINEFYGLSPLSEDKNDQKEYVKYMVGEYYSYKAACEAKRIIASNSKYNDAFIVAYKNNSRIILGK